LGACSYDQDLRRQACRGWLYHSYFRRTGRSAERLWDGRHCRRIGSLEALGRGLALELAPRRVTVLSPGPIHTLILAKALGDGRDAYVASLAERLPLHSFGTAEEAGAAVIFLMANGWMNGEVLHVDGGARLV